MAVGWNYIQIYKKRKIEIIIETDTTLWICDWISLHAANMKLPLAPNWVSIFD